MRLCIDYREFIKVTGKILDSEMLERLALHPSTRLGVFEREQLPELVKFCKTNQQYHIISVVSDCMLVNTVKQDATMYFLGTGDKSENIFYSRALKCGCES